VPSRDAESRKKRIERHRARQLLERRAARDKERAQLARLHVRHHGDGHVEHHSRFACEHRLERRRRALVRNMGEVDVRSVLEELHVEVLTGAVPGARVVEPPASFFARAINSWIESIPVAD